MAQHVKIVAVLSIIFGILMAALGLLLFGIIAGAGVISGEAEAMFVTGTVGSIIGGLFLVLSLPSLIGGIGLLKYRPWARIVIILVAALSLFNIPLGTAYGVYALWALLSTESQPLFA